ncbi:MAG: hypothetical protein JJ920_17380 [Roseitalea sp.]|nr:hypothetical protein [Roseitalea sp.]MBO6723705.1 hypothetical protein [Roseitalea sp.]MBO6744688.1 hypothetical protein [Roseitalea sp.]
MRQWLSAKSKKRQKSVAIAALCGGTLLLAACQSFEAPGGSLTAEVDAPSATQALQRVNERGLTCWIRSGDRAFRGYALVPELDTRSGDPRILVVRKGNAQGLPQLVISASGDPVRIVTFGPLTGDRLSARINADVLAWSAGRRGCA